MVRWLTDYWYGLLVDNLVEFIKYDSWFECKNCFVPGSSGFIFDTFINSLMIRYSTSFAKVISLAPHDKNLFVSAKQAWV